MPKVRYKLSLLHKSSKQPVRGFEVIAQAWGTGNGEQAGQILFPLNPPDPAHPWEKLHDGTDDPLEIPLDRVPAGVNGIAKLTLPGPISGNPKDKATYETYIVLRRKRGGDVTLLFEDCPGLNGSQPVKAAPESEPLDALEADRIEAMFAAKEGADAGNKADEAVFEKLAGDIGLQVPDVRPDWYGRSDLSCHTPLARIADVGVPPTPDKTVQLLYPGASYHVTPPQPLGRGLNNPTKLHARARSGRIWLIVRVAVNPADFRKIWVDVSRTPLQEVVLVPGQMQTVSVPGPTQAPKRAWLPVPRPLRYLFRGEWYDGNDPIIDHHDGITHMDADLASHLASVIPVECHKKAPELVKEIDPNARNIQVLRYRDVRNPHEFEILTHPTNPRHWSGWEYIPGQNGRGPWIRERLFVDQFLVSWD